MAPSQAIPHFLGFVASQSMCSFPLSEKSPEIKQNLQTSLEAVSVTCLHISHG
jgi:hypothetical protein